MWKDLSTGMLLSSADLLNQLTTLGPGVVLLEGPTSCGKTTLINELIRLLDVSSVILSTETVYDRTYANAIRSDPVTIHEFYSDKRFVCVDDVDLIRGRNTTQQLLAEEITAMSEHALVVLSGIACTDRVPCLTACCGERFAWTAD